MNKEEDTDQKLIRYLLGSLSEAETERLDELSVIDSEFAEALGAGEKDLIDGYVRGELTGTVLEQFKSRYLNSPPRLRKVEFAQAFQVFLEEHQKEALTKPALDPAVEGSAFRNSPARNVLKFPGLMAWGLAAAAMVILALVLSYSTGRQPATPRIASFVLSPQTREAGPIRTISVPARTDEVKIDLELEPNDYSTFRVELIDQADNQTVWHSEELTARTTNNVRFASVRFPANLLKTGAYLLRVTGIPTNGPSEVVGDYPFKL